MNIQTTKTPLGWQAIDEDSYDGADESHDCGSLYPIGHGDTEQEAIDDLMEQLDRPYSLEVVRGMRFIQSRAHPDSWWSKRIDAIIEEKNQWWQQQDQDDEFIQENS